MVNNIVNKLKILLVDDEERILRSLGLLLRMQYEVTTTSSGAEALKLLETEDFHVLISDQRMPEITGTELLRQARELSPLTVRILLTGYADVEAGLASINEGEVFRYINKPWGPKELRDTVALAANIGLRQREASSRPEPYPPPRPNLRPGIILVLDPDPQICLSVQALVDSTRPCIGVSTLDEALRLLATHPVAVLICELDLPGAQTTTLIKTLKRAYPQLLTIALSHLQDTRRIVELINQAQVFRYLAKPLRPHILQKSLESALRKHEQFQRTPLVEPERQVEPIPEIREQLLAARLLSQIQRLRSRLFTDQTARVKAQES